ncbi:hypothetical protein GH714_011959 [Hevea brasiliensis]|uniref:Uncharacterized protein n=1 Tax=Hevea brasiliensis TaxID=3981 RepID=A0A6A6KBR4_HEVBR|nr:hypothetical protein GH714_011959 [Hevea brasiliensis]
MKIINSSNPRDLKRVLGVGSIGCYELGIEKARINLALVSSDVPTEDVTNEIKTEYNRHLHDDKLVTYRLLAMTPDLIKMLEE